MAKDDLDLKLEALSRRTGKGIDRAAALRFMEEYDLEGAIAEFTSPWTYEVLSPKQGKRYDENIETYSYVLKRDGEVVMFQPHDPRGEGMTLFANKAEATECAKAQIKLLAESQAHQRRDEAFVRSVE